MGELFAAAHCHRCGWTPEGHDWPGVDRQAEKHTDKAKHPTATKIIPREKPAAAT